MRGTRFRDDDEFKAATEAWFWNQTQSHKLFKKSVPMHVEIIYQYGGPPRGFGEQGKQGIYFRGMGNKGQILRGTWEQRQHRGTGNIRKQIFDFWGTGEQANLFHGNKGTGTPPPLGGPQYVR